MLKVIFSLEKLRLNLNNIQCQIVAKKDKSIIFLSPKVIIRNGFAEINRETEFLIVQNNPILKIQIQLILNDSTRLGGEINFKFSDWDENIQHQTQAQLKKSPDPNARLFFKFIYIRKSNIRIQQALQLCSNYKNKSLEEIQLKNQELNQKNQKLKDQVQKLKDQNNQLKINQISQKQKNQHKKQQHDKAIKDRVENIQRNTEKNLLQKKKNEEILKKIQKLADEKTKKELMKKYPQLSLNEMKQEKQSEQQKSNSQSSRKNTNKEMKNSHVYQQHKKGQDRERSREKSTFKKKQNM